MAHKTEQLKQLHRQKVEDYFYAHIQSNKIQLSEDTGISKTTCTGILKELVEEQVIFQTENEESTGGRPSKQYKLNGDYWHACLISIQNKSCVEVEIRVCNLYRETILKKQKSMDEFQLKCLYEMLDEIMEEDDRIEMITISVPGVVRDRGCIVTCDIRGLQARNLDILLGERYQVEIFVENDVNLAVVGYHQEEESLVFLFQPEKMQSGCGIMINHSLYRGSTLFAGEVGRLVSCYNEEPGSRQHAKDILVKQITAISCILNPEKIVIYSMYPVTNAELYKELKQYIDLQHLPQIIVVDELESYIFSGLMAAAVDQ